MDLDNVILTGGYFTPSLVTEHHGISSGQVTSRQLAGLVGDRYGHACGSYTVADQMVGLSSSDLVAPITQVLLVTGGHDKQLQYVSSTEVISYPDGQAWREVGPLPSPRYGLRGASLAGVFHVTGGYNYIGMDNYLDQVLAWDPVAETWSEAGRLDEAIYLHAITELPLAALQSFCS